MVQEFLTRTYCTSWFACHADNKFFLYALILISSGFLFKNILGLLIELAIARMWSSSDICKWCIHESYVVILVGIFSSWSWIIAYVSCKRFFSVSSNSVTSIGWMICVFFMGGQGAPKRHVLLPLIIFLQVLVCLECIWHFRNGFSVDFTWELHEMHVSM